MKEGTTNSGLLDALDQRIRALRQEARDTEAARDYLQGVLEASAAAVGDMILALR